MSQPEPRPRRSDVEAEATAQRPPGALAVADAGPADDAPGSSGVRVFERAWLAGLFVLLSVLASFFTPNGDDWAWGSQIGLDRLHTFFADYNGRYVANLITIALTRLPAVTPIIVGAALTAIVFLVLDISANRTPWGYAVTTGLLLAMPNVLWSQTVSWLSGFVNYTLATLWVLLFIRAVQRDWRGRLSARLRPVRGVGIVLFSFLASLFMENVTIFLVVASIVAAVIGRRILGRVTSDAWCWVAGSVIGAAVMFSNGAYRRAAQGQAYQQVTGIRGMAGKVLDPIGRFSVVENIALNIALATVIGILLAQVVARGGARRAIAPFVLTAVAIAIAVPLAVAESTMTVALFWRRFAGLPAALLVVALCLVAAVCVQSKRRRALLFACIGASVLLVAPLLVVSPLGPRLFLVTYALMLVILNVLVREAWQQSGRRTLSGFGVLGAVLTLALLANYFVVTITIAQASNARLAQVREAADSGATSVLVQRLPYASYLHEPDPTKGVWETRYKLYYHLPAGLRITLAPR